MDHLSNLLSNLKTGSERGELFIKCPKIKFLEEIINVLVSEGLIRGYRIDIKSNNLLVFLKYSEGVPVLHKINRISKPSRRVYLTKRELLALALKGELIVFTSSQGVFSSLDLVYGKVNSGGEPLFKVNVGGFLNC